MKQLTLITILSLFLISLNAQDHHVRFGFLGNSITIGSGLGNPKEECYPSQIAKLLEEKYGDTCIVGNYAVSGRTMLKNGDYPLWNEPLFSKGWIEAPDICFICLGTNDTKPYNWDVYGAEFHTDYLAMMDTFKLRNPNVKFIVCYPPPAFDVVWDIRNEIVVNGVIPVVDSVLQEREAILVDFYNPLLDSVYLFPDKIHPNAAGAKVMAAIAFDKIVESDIVHKVSTNGTFVTAVETSEEEIRKGDSVTISWVTRNASEVYLNGEKVDANGSKKVAPESTADYWVVAKGSVNTDSLMVKQLVYIPELDKLALDPNRVTINKGEKQDFKVSYYDQRMAEITNEVFSGIWEIIEGVGTLENITDKSVTFVSAGSGKSKLQISVNDITASVSINVEESTGTELNKIQKLKGYPNPCNGSITIPLIDIDSKHLNIELYCSDGKCIVSKTSQAISINNESVVIYTGQLHKGVYLYTLSVGKSKYHGKFIKE